MSTGSEALWVEIFEALVRGGMLPEIARSRVAVGSGRGEPFADAVHARWRAQVDQLVRTAVKRR